MIIVITHGASKILKRLPRNLALRIKAAVEKLPAGDVKRLHGRDGYRLRVGDWRVLFTMDETVITIVEIGPRGDI
jgi:mRNA interferase RelE/StbE